MKDFLATRRDVFLGLGAGLATGLVGVSVARSLEPVTAVNTHRLVFRSLPDGTLHEISLTKDQILSGDLDPLAQHVLGDRITGKVGPLDYELVVKLESLQKQFAGAPIEMVSAYVDPQRIGPSTLRGIDREQFGVSLHAAGQAIDFRLAGVPTEALHAQLASDPAAFGLGLYLSKNFIHLDTGPGDSWTIS